MTIDRNPDIFHDKDEAIPEELIPPGFYICYGKQLMLTARSAKLPFGLAQKRTYRPNTTDSRIETVGIVLRLEHRDQFEAALVSKEVHKAKYPKSKSP